MADTGIEGDLSARAGRREWTGLGVLALPTPLLALDMSVLYLALPQMSADLGAESTEQLWIMDIYGFMIAGFLITMGTLGDRIGRRKLLVIGGFLFAATSVVAAYASSVEMLIGARALMGIAGATLMPSTLALISNMFRNPQQRAMAIAVWMVCFMGGMTVGPIVGGVLLDKFWWGSAFLLGVPVMILLVVTAPLLLPEYRDPDPGTLDLTSVVMSLATILPIIYGLKETAKEGLGTMATVAILFGIAVGAAFVSRQRRLVHPLIDLKLFSNRSLSASMAVMVTTGLIMGGIYFLISQSLQMVSGLSPLRAGLALVPATLAVAVGSIVITFVARRVKPGYLIAGGLVLAAVGFAVITQVESGGGLTVLLVGFGITSFGIGGISPLASNLIVSSAPPEKAGSAASLQETSGEFGIAMGVASLGSLGTAIYRSRLDENIPAGADPDSIARARESISGAVLVGGDLLAPAREAFTAGLTAVAGVGIVLSLALALLAARMLRHIEPSDDAAQSEPIDIRAERVASVNN